MFQLLQVVGVFPLMFSASMVSAVSVQDQVSEQHIPHTQHQVKLIHNDVIQLNVEQRGVNAAQMFAAMSFLSFGCQISMSDLDFS